MDVVRVGFIGLGNITQTRHLPAMTRIGGAQVVAGADPNGPLRALVAERHALRFSYPDYRELIANPEVDAVFVNLPTAMHREAVIAALEAGKHVFCEKPFARTVADAQAMIDAARKTGLSLMVNLNQRFATRCVLLKEAIEKGRLGRCYFAKGGMIQHNGEPGPQSSMARREKSGGGALLDLGSSVIDLVLWLFDFPEVETIIGSVGKFILGDAYNVEDFAAVTLRTADGASMQFEFAWTHNGGPHHNLLYTDLYGTEGGARCRARWSADGPPLILYNRGAGNRIVPEVVGFTPGDSHLDQDRHFIESIRRGVPPANSPAEVLHTLRIIEEVYRQNADAIEAMNVGPAPVAHFGS